MAPFSLRLVAAAALLGVLATASSAVAGGGTGAYTRVFSFGDSLTDTGNALHLPSTGGSGPASRPPYGETFFRRPTGRASDGRLAVDFIVEALRLWHPAPYLASGETAAEFRHGVNLAVGGSTALPPEFYESRGLKPFVPVSLENQTIWFDRVLQILGSSDHGRRKIMASSLFIVGEIGVNDYLVSLIGNLTVGEVKTSVVPHIVAAIRSAVNEVIAAGATTVVVPGMIPLGCEPQLLALYQGGGGGGGGDAGDYDPKSGCMTRLNGLAEHHNRELNRALAELRHAHPGPSVAYADLYRAVTDIVVSPGRYGFRDRPLAACCGGGAGAYNFNMTAFCGAAGSTACADPSAYVSWDGVHFTEAANRHIACAVLKGRPYDDGGAPPAMETPTTWPAAAEAGRNQHGACGYSPSDVTSPLHPRRRRGDRGRWCSSIPRRRRGVRVLLLPRVQLRGLPRRHRQPGAPPRRPRCPRTPPPVRPDLLPPRHRPRFRRQDRHRLHRGGAGAAAPDAVPRRRERRRLPARRELRGGRRDGAGRRVLRAPGAEVRAGLPRHRDGLVQGTLAASWLMSSRAKEDHGELALRRRRDGRQRLPQRHLPEPDSRRGQDLRSRHRRRRPFISHRVDRGWSEDGVGPGDAADWLRAAASRALQARPLRRRLRRRHRLPDEPQRARRAAQPRAHLRHRRAPPRPPRHGHRLRRPLPRRHRHRRLAAQIRVQRRAAVRVLWRRRGPVQRGVGGEVRRRGDGGVRRAIGVRVLGRDTLHGGGQQGDRAWHRGRAVHHATDIVVRIFEQLKKYARNWRDFTVFKSATRYGSKEINQCASINQLCV